MVETWPTGRSRRRIVIAASACLAALAGTIAVVAGRGEAHALPVLLVLAFCAGVVRAFGDPAEAGLEAQVVPARHAVAGIAVLATTGRLASLCGPVAGGFAWAALGSVDTYAAIAGLYLVCCVAVLIGVPERPHAPPAHGQSAAARITDGVRYVVRDQVLFGSMMLDLFAVFFGGATALLPVFASNLGLGADAVGLLRSAMAAGSLAAALGAARFLPQQKAGLVLLGVVAGFGVSMVVFGLSQSFAVSAAALFVAGLCDGVSVVIRRAILRLASPDAMRGRIAAVKSVFVGSSNELGALESGLAATWLGASAAVWGGGLVTLGIVAATAVLAPCLRRLDLVRLARDGAGARERSQP